MQNEDLKKLSRNLVSQPDNYMQSFRKNLDMYVSQKNISIKDIAEDSGLSIETIKTILYKDIKDCKLSTVVALARALKVSVDELVGAQTIEPEVCESLKITRNMPSHYVRFLRWLIRYQHRMLSEKKVTDRSVGVLVPECEHDGTLVMHQNYKIVDISDVSDNLRPKIYMGIEIPCENYMPIFQQGDILLIANDRRALQNETVLAIVKGCIWIGKKKLVYEGNTRLSKYCSLMDEKSELTFDEIDEVIGYVVKVINGEKFE